MRKLEQRLWDRFRANVQRDAHGVILKRIENGLEAGTPDVIALGKEGVVSWVELKAVEELPAMKTTKVLGDSRGLSVEQRNFHRSWVNGGGSTFILLGVGAGQLLIPGTKAQMVNYMTFEQLVHASVAESWEGVREALRDGMRGRG